MDVDSLSQVWATLANVLVGPAFLYMFLGVVIGLIVGVLPGLGGLSGLSLLIPFIYGMDTYNALAMMIGLLAVTTTSDTFPAILMGIPGSAGGQATVMDGFAMAKRGEASKALSSSFVASLFGGLFGALMLSVAMIFAHPVLMAVGFPEQLTLLLVALTLVGMLTGSSALKGLAACGVGLLLGTVGTATATGEPRMTFGTLYLIDGVPLTILALGLFALPELMDVLRRRVQIADHDAIRGNSWAEGIIEVFKHRWLVIRCSALGVVLGAMPGISGAVINWITYGHAIQTAKDKSQFGKGDVRGVIAPESANNATDGGSLLPTLFLGIPGSGTMALFLAALALIGVAPGRSLVTTHIDLTYTIIWTLAIANVIGTGICFFLARPISKLTEVKFSYIAPVMVVLIFFAAYQSSLAWEDMILIVVMAGIGVFMKRWGWSRPALLIGFVLAPQLEAAFYRTIQLYGPEIFLRPIPLGLIAVGAISGYFTWRSRRSFTIGDVATSAASIRTTLPQMCFLLAITGYVGLTLWDSRDLRTLGGLFPIVVASATAVLLIAVFAGFVMRRPNSLLFYDEDEEARKDGEILMPMRVAFTSVAVFPVVAALTGFLFAVPLYVAGYIRLFRKEAWLPAIGVAAGTLGLLIVMMEWLQVLVPNSLLLGWMR